MSKQTEALKLALEGLEKWHFDKDPRGAADYITAIHEALADHTEQHLEMVEQPPCKTGSQCTSKCEQCRYKYDCDKAKQPAQKIVEEYDPDKRTISVYPSEWKAQQQEPLAKDAEEWGSRLNQASWAAIEAWNSELMGPMSGAVFNNIKGVVRAAILKYIEGYTSPPASKPWVGLTPEDKAAIEKIVGITEDDDGWMVSQMFTLTEAKLREKNA